MLEFLKFLVPILVTLGIPAFFFKRWHDDKEVVRNVRVEFAKLRFSNSYESFSELLESDEFSKLESIAYRLKIVDSAYVEHIRRRLTSASSGESKVINIVTGLGVTVEDVSDILDKLDRQLKNHWFSHFSHLCRVACI